MRASAVLESSRVARAAAVAILSAVVASLAVPAVRAVAAPPPSAGGGEFVFPTRADEMSPEQRAEIWREIHENVARLEGEGKLPPATFVHPLLAWPLANWNGLTHPGNHGISGFVDQNPAFPNQLLDWNCGTRTYDTAAGYNHQGDDIFTWPWGWYKMDNNQVAVVAAAPGTIVNRSDGNFDRSCASNNNNWNAIYVRHADNSIAWYGHMKNGSLTQKGVGQAVAQGEYLGIVGSSGNSTGPHLHLEVYDSGGSLDETYFGPCNGLNTTSWWASQRPYYDSAVNHITTGYDAPVFPACPTQEEPRERNVFSLGDPIFFVTYYRDQLSSQTSTYRIYQPDGAPYTSWAHNSPAAHYAASYWYWSYPSFPGTMLGLWRFEVTFNSQTYTTYFSLGSSPASGRVQPLGVAKSGAQVTVSWPASCLSGDTDYDVYEGTIGAFYSHASVTCSTGGTLSHTFTSQALPPGSGSYFLVAPRNPINEGSLGTNSAGSPRPPGTGACKPRLAASCP